MQMAQRAAHRMAATATRRMALAAVGAPLSAAPAAASASAAAAAAAVRGASTLASARVLLSAARPTASKPTPGGPISNFLGAQSEWTSDLGLVEPGKPMACFRVMDERAEFRKPDYVVKHDDDTLKRMYRTMVQLNEMDKILYDAQRQGRISFYMTSYGEEATHIGSASALEADDVIFGQYREAGVLMWRGFTLDEFAHQCFSSGHDVGKGRQMPVHYGSRRLNFQTISSPLGTQLPQAAGAAYALKRAGRKNIVMCYFGEGAASEGDFHVALNMAGTLSCPVVFFCRNNGYAISTPVREQYKGDGIAARGIAYGLPTIRVDGNDLLAVHDATALARERALKDNTPVVIEAMTYRGGHHSTSDDSTRYRGAEEIQYWAERENPITRVRLLLEKRGLWDSQKEAMLRKEARGLVLHSMGVAERTKKPAASQLFSDVYAGEELPQQLREQKEALEAHLEKYKQHYNLDEYTDESVYVNQSNIDREKIIYGREFEQQKQKEQ